MKCMIGSFIEAGTNRGGLDISLKIRLECVTDPYDQDAIITAAGLAFDAAVAELSDFDNDVDDDYDNDVWLSDGHVVVRDDGYGHEIRETVETVRRAVCDAARDGFEPGGTEWCYFKGSQIWRLEVLLFTTGNAD